jgi:alpha-acetolactate decarboxylase
MNSINNQNDPKKEYYEKLDEKGYQIAKSFLMSLELKFPNAPNEKFYLNENNFSRIRTTNQFDFVVYLPKGITWAVETKHRSKSPEEYDNMGGSFIGVEKIQIFEQLKAAGYYPVYVNTYEADRSASAWYWDYIKGVVEINKEKLNHEQNLTEEKGIKKLINAPVKTVEKEKR